MIKPLRILIAIISITCPNMLMANWKQTSGPEGAMVYRICQRAPQNQPVMGTFRGPKPAT
jgi:hypothetical protein